MKKTMRLIWYVDGQLNSFIQAPQYGRIMTGSSLRQPAKTLCQKEQLVEK
ncbi:hypothetical protein [Paenibacillus sanguinis]|nr:hypothetical protein [Paenibacillus sanguinis]